MEPDPSRSSGGAAAYAILVAGAVMLSSNLVIGRFALETVAPWTLAFLRWSIAAAVLVLLAGGEMRRLAAELFAQRGQIVLLAVLGMVICGGGVYVALRHTTATNGTLIYAASPVLIVLMEFIFRGKRATLRQLAGIAIAILGIAIVVFRGDPGRILEVTFNVGDLGIAAAALSWAVYSVVLRRPGLQELPTLPLFAAIAVAAAFLLLPAALLEAALGGMLPTTRSDWTAILALALIPSVAAYSAYQYSVRHLGPTVTGIAMYLMPVSGVALAVLTLGEAFRGYHAAGLVTILAGVALATAPHLGTGGLRRLFRP
jgi:drug/metabolite transporter (DMT)-like permease